jgi:transposase
VDTTFFSVRGEDAPVLHATGAEGAGTADPALITITSGSSRDHREDLTAWMLALAPTHDGDIPLFLQPLDGKSSDNGRVVAAIQAIQGQRRERSEAERVSVADHGVYREAKRRIGKQEKVTWISRVSETSTHAKAALAESDETWHTSEDGSAHWVNRIRSVPQGNERGVMVS